MWSANAHETKKMCLDVKQTFTNGGDCKGWNPMILKCTFTLGITLVWWELRMFRALVGKETNTKLGPQDTMKIFLKHKCLKCLRIVHLDLICISYDQKKGQKSNWEFDF